MGLSSGTKLGPYEIVSRLGAGGMGEVYKARDTRLERAVAIKILPSELSGNVDFRKRLEREARAISNLSHPHICALHDIGHQSDVDFLVMEYLEGETLAETLERRPLTIDQVLRYGIEIADALDTAHRHGIVHRDLKPQNVMITKLGVKLLDFGLAKWRVPDSSNTQTELPTREQSLTKDGLVMGTVQYMSPEQLTGKDVDERADIFAFGAVLYEMTSGRTPFSGDNQASLIASILSSEPPRLSTLRPDVPPLFDQIVAQCLAKDPEDRWRCAHDLSAQLKWITASGFHPAATVQKAKRIGLAERLAWAAAVGILGLVLVLFRSPAPSQPVPISFAVLPPPNSTFDSSIAVSPDGRRLAFVAVDSTGRNIIWVRLLNSLDARSLSGTDGAQMPFWSADSSSIGFFSERKLKTIALAGGAVETICNVSEARGGTWNRDGTILFSANAGSGIYRVSAKGGSPTAVTILKQSEASHRWPFFLPDNRHFLFFVITDELPRSGIYLGSLDSKETQQLVLGDSGAVYASPGYLIYLRADVLMGQPFDANRLKIAGEAFRIAEQPWYNGWSTGLTAFSVGNTVLAYRTGGAENTQLISFDRTGKQLGVLGPPGAYFEPCLSPDEKRISISRIELQTRPTSDIWILELLRGTITRFTFEPGAEIGSLWSPDGKRILYSSFPEGTFHQRLSSGTGQSELVVKPSTFAVPEDWALDSRFISFNGLDLNTNNADIWILPLFGGRKPFIFLKTNFNEFDSRISPDGKWLAYVSDESGRLEIYAQSFPSSGNKVQISTGGGEQIQWRRDGKELFYISPDKKVMSVDIKINSTLEPGVPKVLFQTQIAPAIESRNHYVVTGDGQRFFVNTPLKEITSAPINVLVNWTASLQK